MGSTLLPGRRTENSSYSLCYVGGMKKRFVTPPCYVGGYEPDFQFRAVADGGGACGQGFVRSERGGGCEVGGGRSEFVTPPCYLGGYEADAYFRTVAGGLRAHRGRVGHPGRGGRRRRVPGGDGGVGGGGEAHQGPPVVGGDRHRLAFVPGGGQAGSGRGPAGADGDDRPSSQEPRPGVGGTGGDAQHPGQVGGGGNHL